MKKCPSCGGKLSETNFYKLKAGDSTKCDFCEEFIEGEKREGPTTEKQHLASETTPPSVKVEVEKTSQVRYAGFWIRFGAALLDIIFLGIPITIIFLILFGFDHLNAPALSFESMLNNLTTLIVTVYLWTNWNGQTPGKKLLKIKIVSFNKEEPVGYSQSFIRYIGYIISAIVLLVGYIMIGFRSDKRGLHDLIAGTAVIHED